MLYRTPALDDRETRGLAEVEAIRESLKWSLQSPRRWTGFLRRNNLAKAIRGSNSIEGYDVTADDAIAAVEGEEPLAAEKETWAAIQGYRDAMTYVLELSRDPHFLYDENLIKSLHFMMLKYDLGKRPGRWRPGSIFVREEQRGEIVYEGPDVERVPPLMRELVEELNVPAPGDKPIVRGAMAHLNLAMIHPFSDGNGRMARILQTLVLAREAILEPAFCSIEEYLGRNTRDYYNVLLHVGRSNWSPSNDCRPWIRFCLIAHYRQAKTLVRRRKETERLWNELEHLLASRKLPERTIFALADAASGLKVRNATYRVQAEISDFVASRDLKLLVDNGLLVSDGEKRGRTYVADLPVRKIGKETAEPRGPLDNPFEC